MKTALRITLFLIPFPVGVLLSIAYMELCDTSSKRRGDPDRYAQSPRETVGPQNERRLQPTRVSGSRQNTVAPPLQTMGIDVGAEDAAAHGQVLQAAHEVTVPRLLAPAVVGGVDDLSGTPAASSDAIDISEKDIDSLKVDSLRAEDKFKIAIPVPFEGGSILLPTNQLTFEVKVKKSDNDKDYHPFALYEDQNTVVATFSGPEEVDGVLVYTAANANLKSGSHKLFLRSTRTTDAKEAATFTIDTPVSDDSIRQPYITHYQNNIYGSMRKVGTPDTIDVFGSYMKLSGDRAPASKDLRFAVYKETADKLVKLSDAKAEGPNFKNGEKWDATFKLPQLDLNVIGRIYAIARNGQEFRFSNYVKYKYAPSNLEAATAPTITMVEDKAVTSHPAIHTNSRRIKVDGSGWQENMKVVLFDEEDMSKELAVATKVPTGSSEWQATLADLPEGRHKLFARLYEGDQAGKATPPEGRVEIFVNRTGPSVKNVQPPNFGTAPGAKTLTVFFDQKNTLDPAHAENQNNYRLVPSHGSGVFNGAFPAINPAAKNVDFDRTRNTVNLTFEDLAADIYQLEITSSATDPKDGIRDIYGNPLLAEDGKPGTFRRVLTKPEEIDSGRSGSDDPSQSRGIRGLTGKHVEFPEFTEPRDRTQGFNPSDHVETRVARLYYFRDAHRVAQIINREVKSYNRQGADMKRQLADKARTAANQAIDDRRRFERKAVEAARKTRQAEQELEQNQAALALARRRGAEIATAIDVGGRRRTQLLSSLEATTTRQTESSNRLAQLNSQKPEPPEEVPPRLDAQIRAEEANQASITADLEQINAELGTVSSELAQAAQAAAIEAQNISQAEALTQTSRGKVQAFRNEEVAAAEEVQVAEAKELRAAEDQFRREVAAAMEDPDTYVPGKPESIDPVTQVSVSVIGEGLIQLRGPVKGVNLIRMMINRIDAPVGQVRIGVHTVQVNGEHGDRMEKVVARIQRYIDHSRFLTMQSALMLRKAVVSVASRKAAEVDAVCLGRTQAERDRRYVYAFFGRDFTDALCQMDSEFLKTRNKLLSLHSMDTTSLSAALFVLALAKNDVRMEIIAQFQEMVQCELPLAECKYFEASGGQKALGKKRKFKFLAQNAFFQSFLGFFDHQVTGNDTMTPLQREYIRLAQIFKSRLVTEIELKERVIERGIIEERLGNPKKLAEERQRRKEALAIKLRELNESLVTQVTKIDAVINEIELNVSIINNINQQFKIFQEIISQFDEAIKAIENEEKYVVPLTIDGAQRTFNVKPSQESGEYMVDPEDEASAKALSESLKKVSLPVKELYNALKKYHTEPKKIIEQDESLIERMERNAESMNRALNTFEEKMKQNPPWLFSRKRQFSKSEEKKRTQLNFEDLRDFVKLIRRLQETSTKVKEAVDEFTVAKEQLRSALRELLAALNVRRHEDPQLRDQRIDQAFRAVQQSWTTLRETLIPMMEGDWETLKENVQLANEGLQSLNSVGIELTVARNQQRELILTLDHKKFLDHLIDEAQEKYIDLLEGTRAHTANIDAYIKRLTTALEDDFNTQFYEPAFREVRSASYLWDVNLGQIEATSILTNNRTFAKVSPQATMEFDLPKRDIFITEAFEGAKAVMDDYGALTQDPTFLALTKLGSGQPTSSPMDGGGAISPVRDVLPGLPGVPDETLLSQPGPGDRQFASALEKLIPEPAIYKFETGTGFEIRPVIQPDGQSVVFRLNYMYTTNIREPVRADEKHLGRVKRHFIDTDVQTGNFELREVSRYRVALKASRTARGVPLLQDVPGVGMLFRPLPSAESALQENIILAQSVIYPTLFDLMGLRWAPSVADLDGLKLRNEEYVVRGRQRFIANEIIDYASREVDDALNLPTTRRRSSLYRLQDQVPMYPPVPAHEYRNRPPACELNRCYDGAESQTEKGEIHSGPAEGFYAPHSGTLQDTPRTGPSDTQQAPHLHQHLPEKVQGSDADPNFDGPKLRQDSGHVNPRRRFDELQPPQPAGGNQTAPLRSWRQTPTLERQQSLNNPPRRPTNVIRQTDFEAARRPSETNYRNQLIRPPRSARGAAALAPGNQNTAAPPKRRKRRWWPFGKK